LLAGVRGENSPHIDRTKRIAQSVATSFFDTGGSSLPRKLSGLECFQFTKMSAEVEVAGGTPEEMANYLWIVFSVAACQLT
jgi:hypothetical protein